MERLADRRKLVLPEDFESVRNHLGSGKFGDRIKKVMDLVVLPQWREDTVSIREVADRLGCSTTSVRQHMGKLWRLLSGHAEARMHPERVLSQVSGRAALVVEWVVGYDRTPPIEWGDLVEHQDEIRETRRVTPRVLAELRRGAAVVGVDLFPEVDSDRVTARLKIRSLRKALRKAEAELAEVDG